MKKIGALLIGLGLLVAMSATVDGSSLSVLDKLSSTADDSMTGDCGYYRSYSYAPSYTYATPVLAFYVPLYIPTYTATLDPRPTVVSPVVTGTTDDDRLSRLEKTVDRMAAVIEKLAAGGGGGRLVDDAPGKAVVGSPGAIAFTMKCAKCHDSSATTGAAGKAPVFFKDRVLTNDPAVLIKITDALKTRKMGSMKLPPVTHEEVAAMLFHMIDLPPVAAAPLAPRTEEKK